MLYDIGFLLFSLFYLPTLIFKGKMHSDFGERFGRYAEDKRKALASLKGAIWIEAVSVGEVATCKALIGKLKEKFPGRDIVLSTITKTGNDLARKLFQKDAVIIYFPLDLSWIVRRAVSSVNPGLYIMIETEIWPNMIKETARRGVPSLIVNGRISDRSFGKYKLAKPFLSDTMKRIEAFCMQSLQDAERVKALGAPGERISVTGNMKFDFDISADAVRAQEIRRSARLAEGDMLLVAGSTHPGEEVVILEAFKKLSSEFPRLKLLIAPRHIDRIPEIEKLVTTSGFQPLGVSGLRVTNYELRVTDVLLLDTIGQLRDIYSIATVVFMGGSLVPHGGQNPVEPAALGKPVIFGPHMFNFREISAALLDKGGAILVKDPAGLLNSIRMLLADPAKRSETARCASLAIAEKRGATDRNLREVEKLLHA